MLPPLCVTYSCWHSYSHMLLNVVFWLDTMAHTGMYILGQGHEGRGKHIVDVIIRATKNTADKNFKFLDKFF